MNSPGEVLLTKIILDTATYEDFAAVSDTYYGIEKFMKAVNPVMALLQFQIGTCFDYERFRTYDNTRTFHPSDMTSSGYYIYKTNGEQSFYVNHLPST